MANESTRDDLTKSYAEMNRLRIDEKKNQLATEFQRYKQDCRKKSLEFANDKAVALANHGGAVITPYVIMEEADKYYNWLISIPETK